MKAKRWIFAKHFDGEPTAENLTLEEVELPELKENEILLKTLYLTVDPYMRPFGPNFTEGTVMTGAFSDSVAEVIQSKNGQYPVGTIVLATGGWTTHFISNGTNLENISFDIGETSKSYLLGTLGMPGATAWIGFRKLAQPKAGEIVVITGAAGAVGSLVGQLAKNQGCTVIGIAGSDEKCDWLKNELGFDHVFNYKKVKPTEAIGQVAPDGVDILYDNVGGEFFHSIVNNNVRKFGRIICCGSISSYNDKEDKLYPSITGAANINDLTIRGVFCGSHKDEWPEAFVELKKLIDEGKIKVRETRYEGIEKMRDAFYGLFKGENFGKAIVIP